MNSYGDLLQMDLNHWEPVNNLSTSNGSQLFITTLIGTAFSDPSVDSFALSIFRDNCPQIGDGATCFPITRSQFRRQGVVEDWAAVYLSNSN